MGTKWLASYSIAPVTPRDVKVVSAHPHLMHSIKWGGDISQAVIKDYLISIKTRVNKLLKYTDDTWEYTNPTIHANGLDINQLARRLAEEEYPDATITNIEINYSEEFHWGKFFTRFYKSKQDLGYNHPSTLHSPRDFNEQLPWCFFTNKDILGEYNEELGYEFGQEGWVTNYGKFFTVKIFTTEVERDYVEGYYDEEHNWHPGYWISENTDHPIELNTKYTRVLGTGGQGGDPEFVPGLYTPITAHGYSPSFVEYFDDPSNPQLMYSTIYKEGLDWKFPHIELKITFDNNRITYTWYDMGRWDLEAGKETLTQTELPDTVLPFIPIRLNKVNITDSSLKDNSIAKSIKKACKKLQMNPREILNSIKTQGGMSKTQVETQIDEEIAEEIELNQHNSSYTPPTDTERQQRIDNLLAQERADALEDKNDIFIAFMTSLATENKWEKELLYWTFHRYYSDSAIQLVRAPGDVTEVEFNIPDLYYRISFDRIELTTGASVDTPPASLEEDKYALEIIYQLVHEPLYGTGTTDEVIYTYRGYDQIRLWHMDDSGNVNQLDVYKFSTSLGTPKDLETWDGTLPTDANDYYWALNTIGDKTGDARDIATNKHCIPIHREVLEERTAQLSSDDRQQKIHKLKLLKRCYEYGVCFIIVELKKIHVPWWVSWIKAIAFIFTVALELFAIANFWNPAGWSVQSLIAFVEQQVVNYVVDEVIGLIVEELIKELPEEVVAIISIIIQVVKSSIAGKFENTNNIELALELVDATSSGMQFIRNAENRQLAKMDKELDDKIKELDEKLNEAKEYLQSLNPSYNTYKEGDYINQFNTSIHSPSDFIYEESYYGDIYALLETPKQFINRTIRTANPGLIAINYPRVSTAMLLDPTANLDINNI